MLSRRVNFEFGFNNADFSDRVLHIEITDDSSDSKADSEGGLKRKREDSKSSTIIKVKTFHINSLLLAGNSHFFHKLFKNGMTESNQRNTTLRISASEEAGVMEVLNFIYSNTLKATSTPDLLGVLVVAVKFEAIECVRYCCELLQKMPMSLESAVMYLELPASVLVSELVHPLIDAAKKRILARYRDITRSQEEAMTLPLSAVEVLLGCDELPATEDDIFEFMLKWGRAQYPDLDKRGEILTKNLSRFVNYQNMSSEKLKQVLVCPELDRAEVSKLMLEAFIMMVEDPNGEFGETIHESHKYLVIQVEQFGTPRPRCVVYFDLKKADCENLFNSTRLNSESFRLFGRWFYLSAQCYKKEPRHSFGLSLSMTKGSQACSVEFEFAALVKTDKPCMMFQSKKKAKMKYSDLRLSYGYSDLFSIPWTDFMSEDSEYFIDGILHLRADRIYIMLFSYDLNASQILLFCILWI